MYPNDRSMQPPPSPSRSLQIDPNIGYQSQNYYSYPLPNHSSPSGSESVGTPPDGLKRSASSIDAGGSRKKPRNDLDSEFSAEREGSEPKAKSTRGSRACTVCRRLKMKCVGAENGPPCKRCSTGNHECIFEESNRGKRSTNPRKHEILARSMKKIEKTLDTVLRSLGNPSTASGMISRSPSPSGTADLEVQLPPQAFGTQQLLASPTDSPQSPYANQQSLPSSGSPKLHSLPDDSLNPLGLLAEASLANRRTLSTSHGLVPRPFDAPPGGQIGVASDVYFKPGPMTILPLRRLYIERQVQPEMLSFTSTDEVVALFNIFFDHLNLYANLLDKEFHTPALVCSRSPFLLTTICSISSKFYPSRPELHPKLTELAKKLAFSVPEKGYKSVEIVQAYLLLAWWGSGPVERYEHDRTWMLLGMAIRMATDLNLHRKTAVTSQETEEGRARDIEVHNRERTWLTCFSLDKSMSAQMGKPHTIKEDYIIRHVKQWCQSRVASPTDAVVAGYVEFQRIMSRSLDMLYSGTSTPSGLQIDCDYLLIIQNIESQLLGWHGDWSQPNLSLPGFDCPRLCGNFYLNYGMLVINSFGLQNALERSPVDIGHFFARCHTSATACISVVKDHLAPQGFLKYAPDSLFVQSSYAVLTLLKLLRPELQTFIDEPKTINLIKEIADVLESVAASPLHTPALYSVFLRALIAAKRNAGNNNSSINNNVESSQNDTMSQSAYQGYRASTPMDSSNNSVMGSNNGGSSHGGGYPMLNEFQFDGEMGPVVDMTTFPPTMAEPISHDQSAASPLSFDNIFSGGFWDSVLVPGTANTLEGLSGGFVYGAGGSGLITPRFGGSPYQSGLNSPSRGMGGMTSDGFTQQNLNAAFDTRQEI